VIVGRKYSISRIGVLFPMIVKRWRRGCHQNESFPFPFCVVLEDFEIAWPV